MRPIDKGACPTNPDGSFKTVTDYHYWKRDLEERIGMYCTYCGMPLVHSPQVEHVVPINPTSGNPTGNLLDWNNVVLACFPCNGPSGKGNKNYNAADHYTPMTHNTLLPFVNVDHATVNMHVVVQVAPRLQPYRHTKAAATLKLFNWDSIDKRENKTDYRSSTRWQAKQSAKATYENYMMAKGSPTYNAINAAKNVAKQAISTGFFSLWVETFINEPEVLKWLIHPDFHPGTDQKSFDVGKTYRPISRNPSNVQDNI